MGCGGDTGSGGGGVGGVIQEVVGQEEVDSIIIICLSCFLWRIVFERRTGSLYTCMNCWPLPPAFPSHVQPSCPDSSTACNG